MNRTPTHTACTDAHSVSAHTLNSMITLHHANTRGSGTHSSGLHALVSQIICHPPVVSRSLPHLTLTTSTSSLSHLPHLPFSRSLPHTQVLWCTIHIYPAMIHGGVADLLKSHLPRKQKNIMHHCFVCLKSLGFKVLLFIEGE